MKTPCQKSDPERWVSDHVDEREEAAHECMTACPVRAECYAKALENGEDWGVWGGVDLHPGTQRKPRQTCPVCGTLMPRTKGRQRPSCVGCVETKPCEHCGGSFPRTYHSQIQWDAARFCGHRCSRAAQKAAA